MNKYNSRKCMSTDGILFDSKKERDRWEVLRILEKQKKIKDLQRQVPFELIPSQRGADGKVVERALKYIADFVYTGSSGTVVEDVKGYRNPQSAGYGKYVIKRKLMLHKYGIQIKEV